MALAKLAETTKIVKSLIEELRQETERVKGVNLKVAKEYLNFTLYLAKLKNTFDVQGIQSNFDDLNDRFNNLQEKLLDKVLITFVGATNSGKSSLINALLRDDRLPVAHGESTMCGIKVCTTQADEWKIHRDGEELPQKTEEEVKELLSMMSGEENENARRELQLTTRSVVQTDWPKHLCKRLPENIVLFDTPGFNVDRDTMNAVEDWCKKADIIVVVMDVSSPAFVEVAKLVAKVECQYTFGVYTKWEEYLQKIKKGRTRVDHNQLKDKYTKKYLEKVDRELKTMSEERDQQRGIEKQEKRYEKVFFVDIGSMEENQLPFADCKGEPTEDNILEETCTEGQEGFLKFERALGESARDLKGPILIREADNVFERAGKVFKHFQNLLKIIREKRNEPLDRLDAMKKDLASLQELKESVKSTKELLHAILNDDAINELEEEFCERFENCKSKKETLNQMLEKVNDQVKAAIEKENEEVDKKYKHWRENRKSDHKFSLSEALPNYGIHQYHPFILPRGVVHVLLGICGGLAVGAAVGTAGVLAAPIAVGVVELGLAASGGAGIVGTIGGLAGFGWNKSESEQKKRREVSKQLFGNKLKEYREVDRNSPPLEEIERISIDISSEIESLTKQYESSEEIQNLLKEIRQLEKWIEEISLGTTRLQVMRGKLNEPEREMKCTTVEVSPDDQTEGELKDSAMAEKKEDFIRISGDSDFQGRSNSIFGCLDKLEPQQKADGGEPECKPQGTRPPSRPRRVPDHILHPEKWTKYSLEEDGSERILGISGDALNRQAALSFMDEIRKRKEDAPKENSESDVEMTDKHVFSKTAIKHKMEVDEIPSCSQIVEGVNVMAEYVVGRSQAKAPKTQLSSAERAFRSAGNSVELGHLQDQEAFDDSVEKTKKVSDSATGEKLEASFAKRKIKARKGLRERKGTEDEE